MKQSPRAWLLARHQPATPSLDSARHTALEDALRDSAPVPISQLLSALFFPNRHLWTALAATWALLLALHLSQRPSTPSIVSPQQVATAPDVSRSDRLVQSLSFADRQSQLHALLR